MNGAQHSIATLFLSLLLLRIYGSLVPSTAGLFFIFGAFLSSHSLNIWGIPSFSPDIDLFIGKKLNVHIHRKWYFHSYILMIPIMWFANYSLVENNSVYIGSFLLGINFGWNAHIIEDWLWSFVRHYRSYFSQWVIATSLLGVVASLFGFALVIPEYFPEYVFVYKLLYYTVYFGVVPRIIMFFTDVSLFIIKSLRFM